MLDKLWSYLRILSIVEPLG